ncbi:YbaK / prolyl-tRNA synthetases associated domain protein [Acidithrix ferrooxidans]|uniref:YbaK / prolyl-tRNA synthetases associated domain protein n=2 Tax=Acidimicrobiaceae TaxID=84994 RepID=A0A0D8HK58_9ACTN|nr:YbaK / prolyl-tRNA synthetases associated domain protein [Acidithrix ferrooxidans]
MSTLGINYFHLLRLKMSQPDQVNFDIAKHNLEVVDFSDSTATSLDASRALGVEIGAIGKSIVFVSDSSTVVVLISAIKRVSRDKVRLVHGDLKLRIGSPALVHQRTNYSVGAVSPLSLPDEVTLFVDSALEDFDVVWVSAGTPTSVVALNRSVRMELFGPARYELAED